MSPPAVIPFTVFSNRFARTARRHSLPWRGFVEHLEQAQRKRRKDLAKLVKLATFGDQPTEDRCLRHNANVLEVTGIEGDYDGGQVAPETAVRRLEEHGVRAVVATTFTHTPEAPRWRVFAPLSVPVPPAERSRLVAALNGALGGILGPESFVLSQSFYVGGRVGGDYRVLPTFGDPDAGRCIDELDLREIEIGPAPEKAGDGGRQEADAEEEANPPLRQVVDRLEGVVPGQSGRYKALCPAHDDQKPSLSLTEGSDGRVLLTCHAGCDFNQIVEALGLEPNDLFPQGSSASQRRLPAEEADRLLELRGLRPATIRAFNITADVRRQTWRIPVGSGAKMKRFDPAPGQEKCYWHRKKPVGADVYGLDLLPSGTTKVWLVEGEPDVWIATQAGLQAVSFTGGATYVPKAGVDLLINAGIESVTVCYDLDPSGHQGAQHAALALEGAGLGVEIRALPDDLPPGSDVTDFYNRLGGNDARFVSAMGTLETIAISPAPERPELNLDRRTIQECADLTWMTDEAITAIHAREDLRVFVRARQLVTWARDGTQRPQWLIRPPGSPVIVFIDRVMMRGILARATKWQKQAKKGVKPVLPPLSVVDQVLGRLEWPFPYLEGVIETPTLRPDGSILEAPGHDPATSLLHEPPPNAEAWASVPDVPTQSDVEAAVADLLDPVSEFPFVDETDRAAYLASILSIIGRPLVAGPVPMFAVRATAPGTGKGLLASVIAVIGTGREPAIMAYTPDSEEMRKRVTTLAIDGTPLVLLDNVSGSLGSDVLAGALTATEWHDRILGRSAQVRLPLRSVWLATGNNISFRRTMGRRVVPIDLDAGMENPEDRESFRYEDLISHVKARRPRLAIAALTILRAFHVAGRPPHGGARMGSFEAWDNVVRSAVVWAGLRDPASSGDPTQGRGRIRDQADDDLEKLATLLSALRLAYPGEERFTAGEVIEKAEWDDALQRDVTTAAGLRGYKATTTSLGYALRSARGRPVGRLVLRSVTGKRPRRYYVQEQGR